MISRIVKLFGARLYVSLSGMVLFLLLARRLGPSQQGVVSFSVMLVSILALAANLGLETSTVYFVNRMRMRAKSYLFTIFPLLFSGVLFIVTISLLAFYLGLVNDAGLISIWNLLLILILLPMDMSVQMARYIFQARERYAEFKKMEIIQSVLLMIFVGLVLVFHPTVISVLIAYVVDRLLVITWLVTSSIKSKSGAEQQSEVKLQAIDILKFSISPWLGNLISLLCSRMDMLLLAWYLSTTTSLSSADLGLYTLCMMAMTRLLDAQMAINYSINPHIASLVDTEAKLFTAKMYRYSWLVYSSLFGLIMLFGWPVLYLFGKPYTKAYTTLIILAFGQLIWRSNSSVLSLYFTNVGKPKIPLFANLSAMLANAILLMFLIPMFGINGAAMSTVGSALVMKVVLLIYFNNREFKYVKNMILGIRDYEEIRQWLKKQQNKIWTNVSVNN